MFWRLMQIQLIALCIAWPAFSGLIQTHPWDSGLLCRDLFSKPNPIFLPVQRPGGANQLYSRTSQLRWELDDYGPIYRHSTLSYSESEKLKVYQFRPGLDLGPSRMWIQTLQRAGSMPHNLNVLSTDPRGVRWSDIDRFIDQNSLHEFQHPLRPAHLDANRVQYTKELQPVFDFVTSQYPRRAWFTPEFKASAVKTFRRTLRNANYIVLKDRVMDRIVAAIRIVRVNNGLLRLKHPKSGRVLEILGNAEITWGGDGRFRTSWAALAETFEVQKHVADFLRATESVVNKTSAYDPIELIRLPMETGLGIELPRDFQFMDLRGQQGFENGTKVQIAGENFEVSFGHAVLEEPGLFAIEKTPERSAHFAELALWMGHHMSNPSLPEWVDERKTAQWTYNDLPLYTIFGFKKDERFASRSVYGVDWHVYSASVGNVQAALGRLTEQRTDGSDRLSRIREFLTQMEQRGF